MSDVNLQLVREFFELSLFRVLTNWQQAVWRPQDTEQSVQLYVENTQRPVDRAPEFALTSYEYKLLEHLMRERERVLSKDELATHLYPHDEESESNVIEVLVGRLRKKLGPGGTLLPIETLRGRGYRFVLGDG